MRRSGGFTLLELIAVVALVIILVAVAIENLAPLRGKAERAAVRTMLGTLRSAVSMELARRVVQEGLRSAATLDGANPFEFLEVKPSSYGGRMRERGGKPMERGHWYFDATRKLVIYRLRWRKYVEVEDGGPTVLRFRTRLLYTDVDGSGTYEPGADRLHGVDIRPLDTYTWDTGGSEIERWIDSWKS